MYKHIIIDTETNQHDFFNALQFEFDEEMKVYKLLSQNGEWHMFPAATVKHLAM